MRILEIGEHPFVSLHAPVVCDYYDSSRNAQAGENKLGRREISLLRRKLHDGVYDLVIYHLGGKSNAPWLRPQGALQRWANTAAAAAFSFHKVAQHYFHRALCETSVPLVVIDQQDVARITLTEVEWLDRCRFWFMRELPPNHYNLFLNMDSRSGDITNVQRRDIVKRNISKIEPFGIGIDPAPFREITPVPAAEKIHDVFYIGRNHVSTVRERGYRELQALQAAGRRISIPQERVPKDEFYRACSRAWMVWSPEGQGWDCFRHYDALLSHSVPLINLPTIEQLHPLRHGEHCLYYGPEPGGLTRAVEEALKDPERLMRIAAQGRAYVLEHITFRHLVRHVLAKAGVLEKIEPHLFSE